MGSDSNSSRIPKLRFPGFTGEWEEKKLGDILDYEQPTPYLVASDLYQKQGTPVLTAGKTFILGYTDETVGVYDKVPVIIFDDFVTESKYVTFPFKAKSSAMKMLSLKNKTDNLYFTYVSMLLNQKPVGDHKRHWISETSQIQVLVPPTPAEQQKIASCLSEMDNLISAQSQKVESLKTHKKGLMQQLFPQQGGTTPQLRFPGLTGDWDEKKLGDIGDTYSGLSGKSKEDFEKGNSKFITFMNVLNNVKIDTDILGTVNITEGERQNKVEFGDMLFNTSSETPEEVGFCAVFDSILEEDVYLNSFCFGYRFHDRSKHLPFFLAYYMRSDCGRELMHRLAQGITRFNLSKGYFNKAIVRFPSSVEQQKIASCLSELDKNIKSESIKLESLKNHKRGLMQQLFPEPIK